MKKISEKKPDSIAHYHNIKYVLTHTPTGYDQAGYTSKAQMETTMNTKIFEVLDKVVYQAEIKELKNNINIHYE
jgi:hypothetical protein